MQNKQREPSPLPHFYYFLKLKYLFVPGLCVMLMSEKPFMLNVSNPLAAWHGALLISFLNGSAVKSEVVRVCISTSTSFPAPAGEEASRQKSGPR